MRLIIHRKCQKLILLSEVDRQKKRNLKVENCILFGRPKRGLQPRTQPLKLSLFYVSSVQFSAQSHLTLCNPMDCSTPGFPVHHQLLELTQTHVHRVSDAIQLLNPLSSPSPPAFNLFQHQGLFK